ncbi:MAG: hypothetical protein C4539_06455 [Ignavibacteriales bacterium]|nr:MAG: hypothetical protein C4539_06455 [Ignavibacteriales bacterium]
MKLNISIILFSLILVSCSDKNLVKENIYEMTSVEKLITIPDPTDIQKSKFNENVESEETTTVKEGINFTGFKTKNKLFFKEIIDPLISVKLDTLKKLHPVDAVNELALFVFDIYQQYFGKDFYRWAGDIFDLDDPQPKGSGYKKSFGLDCSGFASTPYELAVHYNLITPEQTPFSSGGFKIFCEANNFTDKDGLSGTSNNFRLDTRDLVLLGREILSVPQGSSINSEQLKMLQAGDLVGRSGHIGILVQINKELFYLESGGWVVPRYGDGNPYKAAEAIEIFARSGDLTIRRCLPSKLK